MPRPKKQPLIEVQDEAIVVMPQPTKIPFYNGMPATVVHTHDDGHLDITVSYDGKNAVAKGRVSPDAIEYR